MTNEHGQAGAIEITPAMLEAGVNALLDTGTFEYGNMDYAPKDVVKEIWRAIQDAVPVSPDTLSGRGKHSLDSQ